MGGAAVATPSPQQEKAEQRDIVHQSRLCLAVGAASQVEDPVALGKIIGGKIQEGTTQQTQQGIQEDHTTLHRFEVKSIIPQGFDKKQRATIQ